MAGDARVDHLGRQAFITEGEASTRKGQNLLALR